MLQSHHHGLLNQVPLNEAPEVLPVNGEVGELESAERHVQQRLTAGTPSVGDVRPGQGHNG